MEKRLTQHMDSIASSKSNGSTPLRFISRAVSDLSDWSPGFLMPAVITMILLVLFPTVFAIVISLSRWNLTESETRTFIGLTNYFSLMSEARFWEALGRTAVFMTISTSISLVLGMVLALLLNRPLPAKNLFRSLLIAPMVVTPVVVGLTWRFMYNPELGMINYLISLFGFEKIAFLGKTTTSLPSVIITDIWQYTPFALLILLAGLESLPREPFEAAQIDGASEAQTFWWITLPMMKGPLLVAVLFRVMFSFNTFDTIYVMTGGGPGRSTETLVMYAYRLGFEQWHMGESAAVAIIMLVIIIVLSRLIIRTLIPVREETEGN